MWFMLTFSHLQFVATSSTIYYSHPRSGIHKCFAQAGHFCDVPDAHDLLQATRHVILKQLDKTFKSGLIPSSTIRTLFSN